MEMKDVCRSNRIRMFLFTIQEVLWLRVVPDHKVSFTSYRWAARDCVVEEREISIFLMRKQQKTKWLNFHDNRTLDYVRIASGDPTRLGTAGKCQFKQISEISCVWMFYFDFYTDSANFKEKTEEKTGEFTVSTLSSERWRYHWGEGKLMWL